MVLVVVLALKTGFSGVTGEEELSGADIGLIIVTLLLIGVPIVDIFSGKRLQRSPRNAVGHSQEKYPSLFINDVHFPPFSHVPGLFSQ